MLKYKEKQSNNNYNRSGTLQGAIFLWLYHSKCNKLWLGYRKLALLLYCSMSFFLLNTAYADNLSFFREIVKDNSKIKSIEADIIQYIDTPDNSEEVYILERSGLLEIHIRESRILKVDISGADRKDVRDI